MDGAGLVDTLDRSGLMGDRSYSECTRERPEGRQHLNWFEAVQNLRQVLDKARVLVDHRWELRDLKNCLNYTEVRRSRSSLQDLCVKRSLETPAVLDWPLNCWIGLRKIVGANWSSYPAHLHTYALINPF
jgi:hypothetical protein